MSSLRQITIDGFGHSVLEEVLFRAGEVAHERDGEAVEITLAFRITADAARDGLDIAVPAEVEGGQGFTAHLPRPF